MTYDQEIVLEVERQGRRPRYHRGARLAGSDVALRPEQCNLDDAKGQVNELDGLPDLSSPTAPTRLVLPWSQLCRRCWAGSDVYDAALALKATYRSLRQRLRDAQAAREARSV